MRAFLYEIILHVKLNLRSKEFLVHFYLVPLIFYAFIGGIFTTVDPSSTKTIIPAMSVFAITMGGVLGAPYPLVEFYGSEIKKAYRIGGIPLWTITVGNFLSSMFHLFITGIIIFMSAPFIFQASIPSDLRSYFLGLFATIIVSLGIGSAFGLYFKNASKMSMMTQLVFLPSLMLSGIMFPVSLLPSILQQIGRILPATWGFQMMCGTGVLAEHFIVMGITMIMLILVIVVRLKRIRFE